LAFVRHQNPLIVAIGKKVEIFLQDDDLNWPPGELILTIRHHLLPRLKMRGALPKWTRSAVNRGIKRGRTERKFKARKLSFLHLVYQAETYEMSVFSQILILYVCVVCCKPEGRGFKSRWGEFFKLT
jgi:hypothetical protein